MKKSFFINVFALCKFHQHFFLILLFNFQKELINVLEHHLHYQDGYIFSTIAKYLYCGFNKIVLKISFEKQGNEILIIFSKSCFNGLTNVLELYLH